MTHLLFLHGWGGDAHSFSLVADYLRRDYQVHTPAVACPPERVYTLEDYAAEIEDYLAARGVTRCCVVAHSFGARLVAVLNARNPQLFSKIIITGGAGLRPRWTLKRWLHLRRMRKQGGSPEYRHLTPAGKQTFQNIVNRDLSAEIRNLTAPTLIIHGGRDQITPPDMAKRWASLVRGSQLKFYPRAGHFAFLDEPARFIKDVVQWLG